jgi:hypothetical protein
MTSSKQDKYLAFLQGSNNFLIVKDSMGKSKPCTVPLPDPSFTYGHRLKGDGEGVSSLITSWAEHKPSKLSKPDKDFKKLNVLSAVEGVHTARDQRRFRRNSDVRVKTASQRSQPSIPDITFGDSARPSTPMKAVLGNFYGEQAAEVVTSNYTPKSRRRVLSAGRTNIAFEKRSDWIRKSLVSEERAMFKLKKFLTVNPRTSTRR